MTSPPGTPELARFAKIPMISGMSVSASQRTGGSGAGASLARTGWVPSRGIGRAPSSYQVPPTSGHRNVNGQPRASSSRTRVCRSASSAHARSAAGASGHRAATGRTSPGTSHRATGPGSSRTASRNASLRNHPAASWCASTGTRPSSTAFRTSPPRDTTV
ncbi:hypothetical protein GA0115246_100026 [Streptomyces sp. SolWspMP-sol7th]|uniref:hypothetical protein n=1 Tax=Streptomyces sp. SolWspMP-sol7th TaxID=1839776 RepID=UPI00081DF643|nr:hypothetical protein [Streptomyces sp. SolWspMP-sol7th]SCD29678.1 hypothetical protein GA0115246_100026 [Streptomyces sp. SolWspMP-sol7th]